MTAESEIINEFLVDVFNYILRSEEKALTEIAGGQLSIKEIHVIEAVCNAAKSGNNTMSELAERLKVTTGTLTVSVNTLIKKGYLIRQKDDLDKRTVRILPCPKSEEVNAQHLQYHLQMVQAMTDRLDVNQISNITEALKILKNFFLDRKEFGGKQCQ